MKIKREQLKAIVKECLVELLQEGLGGAFAAVALPESYNRNRDLEPLPGQGRLPRGAGVDPAAVRRRTMDLTEHRPAPSPVIHEAQRQRQAPAAMNSVVANAAPNAMMAAIFADTATTTFAAQESPTSTVGGDAATRAAAAANPADLFGEDKIDVWNRAAFAPAQPGIMHSPLAISLLKGG